MARARAASPSGFGTYPTTMVPISTPSSGSILRTSLFGTVARAVDGREPVETAREVADPATSWPGESRGRRPARHHRGAVVAGRPDPAATPGGRAQGHRATPSLPGGPAPLWAGATRGGTRRGGGRRPRPRPALRRPGGHAPPPDRTAHDVADPARRPRAAGRRPGVAAGRRRRERGDRADPAVRRRHPRGLARPPLGRRPHLAPLAGPLGPSPRCAPARWSASARGSPAARGAARRTVPRRRAGPSCGRTTPRR